MLHSKKKKKITINFGECIRSEGVIIITNNKESMCINIYNNNNK